MKPIISPKIVQEYLDTFGVNKSEFPVHIFPKQIQDIIFSTNETIDYPIDYIASSLFFACAVAIGNTHCAEVKKGWEETAILYMAIVGSPGINKTHPLAFAITPLLDKDIEANETYKKEIAEYDRIVNLSKKEREEEGISDYPIEPQLKKYVVSDITPESLSSILSVNARGIAYYADELAAWFNNFNRYNKGSEEQFWLMAYSASPIQINRQNMRGSISIKRPYISVTGTIQPGLLKSLTEGSRSKNGFIDRILFVYPQRQRKEYWSLEMLPDNTIDSWKSIVEGLLDLEQNTDKNNMPLPKTIPYSSEAWGKLYEWHKYNTDLSNCEDEEALKGIYSKLEIYISRFALIMQMMRWRCGEAGKEQIDCSSIDAAILITEYFRKTALRVQMTLNSSEIFKDLPSNYRHLYNALPKSFSTADGVRIAEESYSMSRDSFNRFLKAYKGKLFDNFQRGLYKKLI
jgi:hypothetical protein